MLCVRERETFLSSDISHGNRFYADRCLVTAYIVPSDANIPRTKWWVRPISYHHPPLSSEGRQKAAFLQSHKLRFGLPTVTLVTPPSDADAIHVPPRLYLGNYFQNVNRKQKHVSTTYVGT